YQSVLYSINCASCSGGTTINFEQQKNSYATYVALPMTDMSTGLTATSTTTSGVTYWVGQVNGIDAVRARISNYSAGTVTGVALLMATPANPPMNYLQKVGVTGNTGAAMDAAGQNQSSPANELITGGQFNTTPTTITSGNVSPLQLDSKGSLR